MKHRTFACPLTDPTNKLGKCIKRGFRRSLHRSREVEECPFLDELGETAPEFLFSRQPFPMQL